MISIKGIDKAKVLQALHNGTAPLGLGVFHDIGPISVEQCRAEIAEINKRNGDLYFDYYHGRPLKVDISNDEFEERLYDRDAGPGAAQRAIAAIQ